MTTQTEAVHGEEFIIDEANGERSRENITVKSGSNLDAGQVLKENSGKQAYGDAGETAVGILIGAVDATGGAKAGAMIARDAEVDGDLLDWGSSDAAAITAGIADLLALGIIVR